MSNFLHAVADALNALGARVVFREEQDARDFAENITVIRESADELDSPRDPTPLAAESDESVHPETDEDAAAAPSSVSVFVGDANV